MSSKTSSRKTPSVAIAPIPTTCNRKECTGAVNSTLTCGTCKDPFWCSKACRKADSKAHRSDCTKEMNRRKSELDAAAASCPEPAPDHEIKHAIATYVAQWFYHLGQIGAADLTFDITRVFAQIAGLLGVEVDEEELKQMDAAEKDAVQVVPDVAILNLQGRIPERKPRRHEQLDDLEIHEVCDRLVDASRLGFALFQLGGESDFATVGHDMKWYENPTNTWPLFLRNAREREVVPRKWGDWHIKKCTEHGMENTRKNNIYEEARPREIQERYGDRHMPLKLLVLFSRIVTSGYKRSIKSASLVQWLEDSVLEMTPKFYFKK